LNRILLTIGYSLQGIARTVANIIHNKYFVPSLFALLGFVICYLIVGSFLYDLVSRILLSCCVFFVLISNSKSKKAPVGKAEKVYEKVQSLMRNEKYSTAIRFIEENINIELLSDEDFKNDGYYKRIIRQKALCYHNLYMTSKERDKKNLLYAIKEYERCVEYFNADDYPYEYCSIKNDIAVFCLEMVKGDNIYSVETKSKIINALDCGNRVYKQHSDKTQLQEIGVLIKINYINTYLNFFSQTNDNSFLEKSITI
jgi:hypothetical protein